MPPGIIKHQDGPEQEQATNNISLQQPASFLRVAILALLAQACGSNIVPVRGQQPEARQTQQHVEPEPANPEPVKTVSEQEARDQAREREEQRRREIEATCHYPAPGARAQVEELRRRACLDHVRNRFLQCMAQGNTLPSLIPSEPAEWERRCQASYVAESSQCGR